MFMGLFIALLVFMGVATAVASGVLAMQRRRELAGQGARAALPSSTGGDLLMRTIRDLRVGDVITYESRDFVVEGVVMYEEEGHRWNAGRLVDGDDVRWLVVGLERGGSTRVRVLAEDPSLEVSGYPPDVLVAGEQRYAQERRGTATATIHGNTGLAASRQPGTAERCRWWLYEAPGDDTMVVEKWSDIYRVLRGKTINAALVDLIPGS